MKKTDLERIVDASPAVHYVAKASPDYGPIYVSKGVRAQLGYGPDELTRDPAFWLNHIHPEDRPRVLNDLAALIDKESHVHEYRFLHADGSWRWMHDDFVLARDGEAGSNRMIGSWLDITERRKAEDAQKRLASRLNEAQRIAALGSWEVDVVTEEAWWSDETYRIFDEDPDTYVVCLDNFIERVHPDDRQRFMNALNQAEVDGEPYSITYRVVLQDGTEKIIHGRGYGVAQGEGPLTYFAGTVQDITQRETIERALRSTEARNRALLEANPDVLFRIDADGRYLDLSISAGTEFPYTRDEFVGRNVRDLFGNDFADEHQRHVRKAIETGEMQVWECRMAAKPHGDIDVEARFVRSGHREAVVTVRDVTELLQLQREVVFLQERERRRIGLDLHDDLGQELTGISLGLEVLAQKLADAQSPHVQAVQDLKAMTLRSISSTRRIAQSLSPAFGSGQGITEALELLASEISEHSNTRCRARCSADHKHDMDVEANLYRIAQECVTNSVRHGSPKNIELRYGCNGETIQFEVLDDGTGIPSERDRVEGMGLRSMRYRARLVNGTLQLGERPEGGARVSCSCPCQR